LALFNNVLPTVSNGKKTMWMKSHNTGTVQTL